MPHPAPWRGKRLGLAIPSAMPGLPADGLGCRLSPLYSRRVEHRGNILGELDGSISTSIIGGLYGQDQGVG